MMIYRIRNPIAQDYAKLWFEPYGAVPVCQPTCPLGAVANYPGDPERYTWLSDRDNKTGDFISMHDGMAVTKRVFERLTRECGLEDIYLQEILVVSYPDDNKPPEPVFRLRSRHNAEYDFDPSSDFKVTSCSKCGRRRCSLDLSCVDDLAAEYHEGEYVPLHIRQRKPGRGVILRKGVVPEKSLFNIRGYFFATEAAKVAIDEAKFTNVVFSEYGEFIP